MSGNAARSLNEGGGLYNAGGTLTLRATVFDSGPTGANCFGGAISLGGNLADDASCFPNAGSDKVVADVLLGPLANNGGPTMTHALLPGSPAIDWVTSGCPPPPTDQRGVTRPLDGDNNGSAICDSGSFELEAARPSSPSAPAADAATKQPERDDDEKRKLTEEQRQQKERTNASNRDDYVLEGSVVGLCAAEGVPPCVIVANRDGNVAVVLLNDAAKAFGTIRVGDYLEAEGEKQHELLFHADGVEITRDGKRVK